MAGEARAAAPGESEGTEVTIAVPLVIEMVRRGSTKMRSYLLHER